MKHRNQSVPPNTSCLRGIDMNKLIHAMAATGVLALGLAASGASAQVQGYVTDTRGGIVKDPFGLCWRTGFWTPALANAECDPELVPKPAPAAARPGASSPAQAGRGQARRRSGGKALRRNRDTAQRRGVCVQQGGADHSRQKTH